ncbi:MAG: hypothetical protein KKG99_13435 [Bacteroidetes bacterium]|nr:hypothetical protein [Bacteroidota bacterium]
MQKSSYLIIAGLITLFFIAACEKKASDEDQIISGRLISNSECKSLKSNYLTSSTPDSISSVEYNYSASNNKLMLKHINAGFNCCPGILTCVFRLNADTIIIQEYEEAAQCHCDCLYDLEIEIDGVKTKKYQIKFIEPYATNLAPLIFELDLTSNISGSYSVVRKQYPWGISNTTE